MIIQTIQVLAHVFRPQAGASVLKVKVCWGNDSAALVTMEDEQDLRHRFLEAPVWGQAVSQQGVNGASDLALRLPPLVLVGVANLY